MSKKTLTPEDEILKAVEAYHQRKKAKGLVVVGALRTIFATVNAPVQGSARNPEFPRQCFSTANCYKSICKLAFSSLWRR
jgi:hypothetical protein